MSGQSPRTSLDVQRAFDAAASNYDEHFNSLPATQHIRGIMWERYLTYFQPGMKILELNCGTGLDAIMLGQHGIHVHATDISEGMIEVARKNIASSHMEGVITTGLLRFDEIDRLRGQQFDGSYSNFGGLNCTDNLTPIALNISEIIRPGGILILCLMSDFALWETLSFLLRGRVSDAFRRRNAGGVLADVHGHKVRTYYFSPRRVLEDFHPYFSRVELGGLNIFTPPPSSRKVYARLGGGLKIMEKLDDLVFRTYPFSRSGDHFFLVLRRTGVALHH